MLAKYLGCPFFETSAKTRQNINEAMTSLVREFVKKKGSAMTTYLTGKDVYKFVENLHKRDFSNCEIPSINKNMKNIWINIFGFLLKNGENRSKLKLVCKYWYNLVSQIRSNDTLQEIYFSKYYFYFQILIFILIENKFCKDYWWKEI